VSLDQVPAGCAKPRSDLEWLGLELALMRYFVGYRPSQATILARLCRHAGKVMSPDRLTINSATNPDVVPVYVCYLREAMDDLGFAARVENVKGAGYRLSEEGANEVWERIAQSVDYLAGAA
jgi:DNA-binding winged helix-turn-helix (wHTH) protein